MEHCLKKIPWRKHEKIDVGLRQFFPNRSANDVDLVLESML